MLLRDISFRERKLRIILSRIFLAAHSGNQMIYGSTLGFGIYFITICIKNRENILSKIEKEKLRNTKPINNKQLIKNIK